MSTDCSGLRSTRNFAAVGGVGLVLVAWIAVSSTLARAQPVEHLIICPADFVTTFEPLASHRTQAGISSAVVALEDALASAPPGRDDAETLRNYLVEQHALGSLRYVLLGGDSPLVPVRTVRSTFYPPGSFSDVATDLYYAGLDGDWDADGDGFFGEPFVSGTDPGDAADLDPDIAIGRAPVNTVAQAERFVAGVLAYDNATDASYFASALLMAEVLFWNGDTIVVDGAEFAEAIRAQLLLHPSPIESTRLYENSVAYPGSLPLTLASATAALGSGFHGTIYHAGTGNYQEISVGDALLGVAEVDALTNAPNYSVIFLLTSNAARFTADAILEHFVTAPQGGSAAAVGFTDVVFPLGANDYEEQLFVELTAASGVLLGDAMTAVWKTYLPDTFYNTARRWTSLTMELLGDPAMPYRGDAAPVPAEAVSFGKFKARYDR
jgi:hypothetical protein